VGYSTDFTGEFHLNQRLDKETQTFLEKFAHTRRMKRNIQGYGVDGEFYVDGGGDFGQADDSTVVDHNRPPSTQPGLWCQWVPNKDGTTIEWDGGEKFYDYVEWLKYIITNFLAPKGYVLNGLVEYQGEDNEDFGAIAVKDNKILLSKGIRRFGRPEEA
jgi:hypothetical protein